MNENNFKDLYKEVLNKLIEIYKGYSKEYRATTQPYHLAKAKDLLKGYEYDPTDLMIRESLIEHVGSLPIVTSFIFPYINDVEVDLGHTLALLSVHDIGELVTGDEITFSKQKRKIDKEKVEALKLLHPSQHELYLEAEEKKTKNAKFAKSIDKITPDIIDLITPAEITILRYKHFMKKEPKELVPMIREFKHPYMLWNKFMTGFHLYVLERLDEQLKNYY